jgi:N-acetyl-anhydromuramyl-L-alanine amidase AmpD
VAADPLGDIPFVQARNYTRVTGRRKIDLVVIHTMEAPEKPSTAESIAAWFAGASAPQASPHYNIDNDSIVQSVAENDVAWAAPGANHNGIQLEHAGYARQTAGGWADAYSQQMLRLSASLTADICQRHGIPPNYVNVVGLQRGLKGVTTHANVSAAFKRSDHTDPGENFPMAAYLAWVREAIAASAPPWYLEAQKTTPMWAWIIWHDHGAPADLRPTVIPARVPKATLLKWAARYALHRGSKPWNG